ncbi:hypothetical protein HMPREF0519_1908 [Lentilactobacillus hilgardii DSM 20176 = ATCC 8290]|uniref:Uncharacterized protein n=1 Tax=Lentilactobacillus hilgardii (strain ATCC 8290 / DSM 20176 / CCUG 30140 / JCM 1155 / KCTC 3500 / NBRC 15886 / NCIMB 8040 / NRRL B-1843 / 9) TaxID=1423757 RepID=C0XKZ7_LENH9|nr:hypothetical protein HMPREF0519_1908 [Lentilactobacillus hilgardii DSM 20176 = ATCC 8290]
MLTFVMKKELAVIKPDNSFYEDGMDKIDLNYDSECLLRRVG